jgi:hypothetical protein
MIGLDEKVKTIFPINTEFNKDKLSNVFFEKVGDNLFYDKNQDWLILNQNDKWYLLDLKAAVSKEKLEKIAQESNILSQTVSDLLEVLRVQKNPTSPFSPFENGTRKISKLIQNTGKELLVLDNKGDLWMMDLNTFTWIFVDSGVAGIAKTERPSMVWVWKGSLIYRMESINSQDPSLSQNYLKDTRFLNLLPKDLAQNQTSNQTSNQPSNQTQADQSLSKKNLENLSDQELIQKINLKNFRVTPFFQGYLFQFEQELYYFSDITKNLIRMDGGVLYIGNNKDTLFWIDNKLNLKAYSFTQKYFINIGKVYLEKKELIDLALDRGQISMYYDYTWNRLFVYSPHSVFSVWLDTDNYNEKLIKLDFKKWIADSSCLPEIRDRFQYCLKPSKNQNFQEYDLVNYHNLNIW